MCEICDDGFFFLVFHLGFFFQTTFLFSYPNRLLYFFFKSLLLGGTPQGCLDVMPALLHCADVCNPTKPWGLYEQWTDRIMQEFFDQGDDERMLGLNVTFDKSKIHLPKFQSYFIQGFVRPIFERLNECSDFDGKVLMDNMNDNVNRWKEQLEKSDDAKTNSSSGEKTKDEGR